MFGSDQMIWPEAIGMAIEGIEAARFLTPGQKRDIFYHNASRFLRLDQKQFGSTRSALRIPHSLAADSIEGRLSGVVIRR